MPDGVGGARDRRVCLTCSSPIPTPSPGTTIGLSSPRSGSTTLAVPSYQGATKSLGKRPRSAGRRGTVGPWDGLRWTPEGGAGWVDVPHLRELAAADDPQVGPVLLCLQDRRLPPAGTDPRKCPRRGEPRGTLGAGGRSSRTTVGRRRPSPPGDSTRCSPWAERRPAGAHGPLSVRLDGKRAICLH
jgi:hypothetical protein